MQTGAMRAGRILLGIAFTMFGAWLGRGPIAHAESLDGRLGDPGCSINDPSCGCAVDGQCADCFGADCRNACGCNGGDGCPSQRLFGLFARSDRCFTDFVSPMTNPIYFEDPRTLTESRTIFANHVIPNRAPLAGGHVQFLANQLRVAINDDLSIIATKDGFFFVDPNAPLDDGWADVSLGLKYNLLRDPESQRIISAGLTYELPVGSTRALQGRTDGEFNMFLTAGTLFGDANHYLTAAGFRLPADGAAGAEVFYWSHHVDRRIADTRLYAFSELNWYHWIGSGNNGVPGIEGLDLFDLGSTSVAGNDIVSGAFGVKFKPTTQSEVGVAWELPLTNRRDVLDNRLTADLILRY